MNAIVEAGKGLGGVGDCDVVGEPCGEACGPVCGKDAVLYAALVQDSFSGAALTASGEFFSGAGDEIAGNGAGEAGAPSVGGVFTEHEAVNIQLYKGACECAVYPAVEI